jgi:hypothetical protein
MSLTLELDESDAQRPFLVTGERTLSFDDARKRIDPRVRRLVAAGCPPLSLEARPDLDTVLWMLAAICAGAPLVPLHARLTAAERAEAQEQVAALNPHSVTELPAPDTWVGSTAIDGY